MDCKFLILLFSSILLVSAGSAHIVNEEVMVQESADSGTIYEGDSGWLPVMSQEIETDGNPMMFDFHATTRGCSHHTWAFRVLVDGEEESLIRQTDSDSTNQKMAHTFDVLDEKEGESNVEVEWRLYEKNTYQSNYDRAVCGEEQDGVELQIEEAHLKLMELDQNNVNYSIKDANTSSTSGSWSTILSDTYTIEEQDSVISIRGLTSAHYFGSNNDAWYRTRLTINGTRVSYSRTAESNDGYKISSTLDADRYDEGEVLDIELQWRDEGYQHNLDGADARLGVFEFQPPVDLKVSQQGSGSPSGTWETLLQNDITTENEYLFTQSQISADVSNNEDYFARIMQDQEEVAWQSTGVSDDTGSDTIFMSTLEETPSEETTTELDWRTEGGTSLEDSKLAVIGLQNTTGDFFFCDRRGVSEECISETSHSFSGQSFDLENPFVSESSAVLESYSSDTILNITSSAVISGLWSGGFQIKTDQPRIEAGASFRPEGGRIVVGK